MTGPNVQTQDLNSKPRDSKDQYLRLLRCSDKRDMTEWNDWREKDPDVVISLEDANLLCAYLEGANLDKVHLERANLSNADLKGAYLVDAHLEGANLQGAHVTDAQMGRVHLQGGNLKEAHLEGAKLSEAHIEGACLMQAHLEDAILTEAHLEGARLQGVYLRNAQMEEASLQGAVLEDAYLESASVVTAFVDGTTVIWNCAVDRETDFRGVALDSIRIDPGTKQLIEHNARRKNWELWYEDHPKSKWFVQAFWWISNYGSSTGRIAFVFFVLALVVALIYYVWGKMNYPGIIENLFEVISPDGQVQRPDFPLLRSFYFSVTTMTTLGFGEIHADIRSTAGHFLVIFQVLSGYVLLGAIITRLSILFTAGGPAGKFAPTWKKAEGNGQNGRNGQHGQRVSRPWA